MSTEQHTEAAPWWDLTPDSPEIAEQRRTAMNEALLDDERWIRRRQELLQQQQHP